MDVRNDFQILRDELVYLDSTATTLKPRQVVEKVSEYYNEYSANIHRGLCDLSQRATDEYEQSREKLANFVNASTPEEIIFTKNATESLNLVAYSLGGQLEKGDHILLSVMEHHSNMVPWQRLVKKGIKVDYVNITDNFVLDMDDFQDKLMPQTKIVSLTHVSNVLGTINPINELTKMAHEVNALMVVDAAASVPHLPVDVQKMDCDLLAFSGHKMLGPTGIGVLYGKQEILEKMPPFLAGGGMISNVTLSHTEWGAVPEKFEAGTPNIAGAIGLGAAVDYLQKIGMDNVRKHGIKLTKLLIDKFSEKAGITVYGPTDLKERSGVVSFNVNGVHAHDVASILNENKVCVRSGHHCAQPLIECLGVDATARASVYVYNNESDIDKLITAVSEVEKVFANV